MYVFACTWHTCGTGSENSAFHGILANYIYDFSLMRTISQLIRDKPTKYKHKYFFREGIEYHN